jgi:hypothetical protein
MPLQNAITIQPLACTLMSVLKHIQHVNDTIINNSNRA